MVENLSRVDLRSRNGLWLKIFSWFAFLLLLFLVAAGCGISSYLDVNVISKYGTKDEKKMSLASSIMLGVAILIILIYFLYVIISVTPKVEQEDEMLTNISRISTVPLSSYDLKKSFSDYLTNKLKRNFDVDNVSRLNNYMNGNYSADSTGLQQALKDKNVPVVSGNIGETSFYS